MKRLYALLGGEHELADTGRELRAVVRSLSPSAVGAMLVRCADETEHEAAEVFHRTFAQELLPRLKYGNRVPFHLSNPGARYEWGVAAIAEDHFATPEAASGFKVFVAKVNAHVAVQRSGDGGLAFGSMQRYGAASTCCGAVHATLAGSDLPFAQDLTRALRSEGRDRLATLREQVAPEVRPFFGAIACARLQARFLAQDLQEHAAAGPTLYLVMHGVTLNKPGPDTELVGGVYAIDRREGTARDRYCGLGDDPGAYRLTTDAGRIRVRDAGVRSERAARDHRELARSRLATLEHPPEEREAAHEIVRHVRREHGLALPEARALLKPLLVGLATASPVPAAVILAAEGALAVRHLHHLHQATDASSQRRTARDLIASVEAQIDALPADVAERAARQLVERLGPRTTTTH